jgi:hypothetical protein
LSLNQKGLLLTRLSVCTAHVPVLSAAGSCSTTSSAVARGLFGRSANAPAVRAAARGYTRARLDLIDLAAQYDRLAPTKSVIKEKKGQPECEAKSNNTRQRPGPIACCAQWDHARPRPELGRATRCRLPWAQARLVEKQVAFQAVLPLGKQKRPRRKRLP